MICKKDTGNGKAFWTAVTASRVVLPNGGEAERMTYEPTGWYLLSADGEYLLYPVEKIERITGTPGSRLKVHPVGEPYAIYDDSEYDYELEDNSIVIKKLDQAETRKARCIEFVENADSVSNPLYYTEGWSNGAEVIDLTEHLSFCAGNVVKYVCRAGRKDPDKYVEDLEKARWYLDREIGRVRRR